MDWKSLFEGNLVGRNAESIIISKNSRANNLINHKNYNFPDCDWFKKFLFSTYSLAKLLSDNSISQSHSKL